MFVSVDLPIPGEPPSSVSEPGTRPPPSTRSSSPMPVGRRVTGAAPTSRSRRGATRSARLRAPPAARRREAPPPEASGSTSSTSVFHAPQVGHWPCHFASCAPQSEQTWTVLRGIPPGYAPAGTGPHEGRTAGLARVDVRSGYSEAMSVENVELVRSVHPPSGTDLTMLFGGDPDGRGAFARIAPLLTDDFEVIGGDHFGDLGLGLFSESRGLEGLVSV